MKTLMLELSDSKHKASGSTATKTIRLKRLEARDRRLAAIHEAAHHVITVHRGMKKVESWIERVGDPTLSDKAWVGHCSWRIPSRASSKSDVMMGVAGMVAEELWKAGNDPDRMDYIYDSLDDPDCMSQSDWRNAGLDRNSVFTKKQRREIEAVIDLLSGPLRSELLVQARRIIIESRDIYTCNCC